MTLVESNAHNMLNMQKDREIGSEFWFENPPYSALHSTPTKSQRFFLSGRTAIDAIIQDILKNRAVGSVYLPAWGCDSMITPFRDRGIKVDLYDVCIDDDGLHYDIDNNKTCDIFYVNNYFGYHDNVCSEVIKGFKKRDSIILYDKTHSLLMDNDEIESLSDYTFASIRKWMGVVSGAVVNKQNGFLISLNKKDCPYLDCKIEAMKMKAAYIGGDISVEKQNFLNKYGEFGYHLEADYRNYRMDDLSFSIFMQTDLQQIQKKRRANAKVLHDNLDLKFISSLSDLDCPLFVPIFFESREQRDAIRKVLIAKDIYCPIHWPKNHLVMDTMNVNHILNRELSLVCDQRYTEKDMERIVMNINRNL